jgi:hypothetical protein
MCAQVNTQFSGASDGQKQWLFEDQFCLRHRMALAAATEERAAILLRFACGMLRRDRVMQHS